MESRPRILIVDDEPVNLEMLGQCLTDAYTVVAAVNGEEALARALQEPRPDLIMLDILMPGMDGYKVCAQLKKNPETLDIPVIFVSSMDDEVVEAQGFELGAVDYVTKPFRPMVVLARVESYLELRRQRQALERLSGRPASAAVDYAVRGGSAAEKSRILVVDDEPIHLSILNGMLGGEFEVLAARDGEEALKRAAAEPRPDMILLDVQMPGMDGYEACRALKENPRTAEIPVLFLTGRTDAASEQKGLELGAVDYVAKPFNAPIVLARIRTHLRLSRALETLAHRNLELEEMIELRESVERISRHDLKTPLGGIIGLTPLLLESGGLSDQNRKWVSMIEESGYVMLEMINRSLDLLKMEQGSYALDPEPVDLVPVMGRIINEVRPITRAKKTTVSLLMGERLLVEGETFVARGEPLLYYSLFSNLIKNAVEAAPESEAITVSLRDGETATAAIHNPGAVPVEIRDSFFDKYATWGKPHGAGLGAYSARLIAETLKGGIALDTSEVTGTTVTVMLPSG